MKPFRIFASCAAMAAAALAASAADAADAKPKPKPKPPVRLEPLAPSPDAPLEESVRNETERALELAEAWLAAPGAEGAGKNADSGKTHPAPSAEAVFGLKGLNRTEKAVKLVSLQRVSHGAGHWEDPRPGKTPGRLSATEATLLAVAVLRSL